MRAIKNILKATGFLTAVLAGLELALRPLGYGSYILYEPSPTLLWVPLPNQAGVTVAGHAAITINSEGLRYRTKIAKKEPGIIRVFTFGDSVTMGWGVDDDSHYSAILEHLLRENADNNYRYKVISAGVNAYPTSLCIERFLLLLKQGYQIDVAVLAYSFNTGFEGLAELSGPGREAFLRKVRLKTILRRSAIYNFLIEDVLRQAVYYTVRTKLVKGSWDVGKLTESVVLEQYLASIEHMRVASEKHGVKLVMLLLGSAGQTGRLNEYQEAFAKFAERNRLPLVDMVEALKSVDQSALFMDHTHPSPLGHRLIAAKLLPVIQAATSSPSFVESKTPKERLSSN